MPAELERRTGAGDAESAPGDSGDRRIEITPDSWLSPRGAWDNVVFLWRTSLPFRTISISMALTSLTVLAVGFAMSSTIANDLFTTRLEQVLAESDRAAGQVQEVFESGSDTDAVALNALRQSAVDAANKAAPGAHGFAFYGTPDQHNALEDFVSGRIDPSPVSDALRAAVRANPDKQMYQPVGLPDGEGREQPGIVVGTTVTVPTAGRYELYFVYSLAEAQETLDFIQRTLAVSMTVLVILVSLITGFTMRAVIQPIRIAAQTSRKLATGKLTERVPEHGEDDIATLARSFNHMADSLQEQIERLGHVSQVQQRFVSDVSHELRTPLTTIRLAGSMLFDKRDEFTDPVVSRSVELLHDQIERFEILLSDLLEISRFDAGAVEILRERNSLVTLADEVIGSMTQVALDHGSRLALHAPGGGGECEFDARRISRVVRNLVGNAIEHGEGRPIVISVDSSETAAAISVRDYGVGMTPEQMTRVFDRFWRADPSRKRTMGGSGLGLAISQEDAALHDGRLEVWSRPGLGSNFRLTLPRRVGDEIVLSPLPLEPPDAGARTIELEAEDVAGTAFTSEDVDTQPIILPTLKPSSSQPRAAASADGDGAAEGDRAAEGDDEEGDGT